MGGCRRDGGHIRLSRHFRGLATGGALGSVSKSDLDPTFANAAFSLDVNELSHVVETDRGFHVIVRTE